jgi:hypothetical protein
MSKHEELWLFLASTHHRRLTEGRLRSSRATKEKGQMRRGGAANLLHRPFVAWNQVDPLL